MAADPDLIASFVRGWALTRGVSPPLPVLGGHYVAVGQSDQKARYVFPTLDADTLGELARSIREPWIYLKVCAPPESVRAILPTAWAIREPATFMMTARLRGTSPSLPEKYHLLLADEGEIVRAQVERDGEPVARARIALLGDVALFDQVSTGEAHRRRGLGRALMQALAQAALDRGAPKGLLCASEMGRCLYESLGWTVHAPYTSAVIPV